MEEYRVDTRDKNVRKAIVDSFLSGRRVGIYTVYRPAVKVKVKVK